jgi:hypothetical protein
MEPTNAAHVTFYMITAAVDIILGVSLLVGLVYCIVELIRLKMKGGAPYAKVAAFLLYIAFSIGKKNEIVVLIK